MNILLVTEFFPDQKLPVFLGGVQARTFFVVKNLRKKHDIKILSQNAGKIEATTTSLLPRFLHALRVVRYNPKDKPNLIEASNVTSYLPAYILAKRLRVPAIAWVPDVLGEAWREHFSLPVAEAGRLLENIALKLPWDHIIAMSQTTREKLIKAGVKKENITVVYGGVEYERLAKLKAKKFDRPTVISIARLLPYKRLNDLIDAVAILSESHPEIQCIIIGEGPEKVSLKSQISSLKLSNAVKLVGNMPYIEAMKTLKRSHLFCLPSVVEGFGIVTVEAMAAGVPYVNARITPTVEVTENGKGGLLYEPKNPRDLAEKVVTLLADGESYKRKQKEGQKLAKRYDWSIIARKTEAVYKKAIESDQY